MENGPMPPGKALMSVWELEATATACDYCNRNARFLVYLNGVDYYYCLRHTVAAMHFTRMKLDRIPVGR